MKKMVKENQMLLKKRIKRKEIEVEFVVNMELFE
jgi:hypothetical protein